MPDHNESPTEEQKQRSDIIKSAIEQALKTFQVDPVICSTYQHSQMTTFILAAMTESIQQRPLSGHIDAALRGAGVGFFLGFEAGRIATETGKLEEMMEK